jgi:YidC/Oxa1 family membrane protein insertase
MDQKRFIAFGVISLAILIGWNVFVMPHFMPPPKPRAAQNKAEKKADDAAARQPRVADKGPAVGPGKGDDDAGKPEDESAPDRVEPRADGKADENLAGEAGHAEQKDGADHRAPAGRIPKFPDRTVQLGSEDFATGYRQLVTLTSKGAAVRQIQLNDSRYRALKKNAARVHPPQIVVGDEDLGPRTFETDVPQVKARLDALNWELVELTPAEEPHSVAVFRLQLDDLEIVKRYELPTIEAKSEAPAYSMKVNLTFRNLGKQPRTINYVLEGPTGLPLENIENTQKFRDIVVGFETGPGKVTHELMAGKTVASGKGEQWAQPAVKYIGTDVQFFAALVCPVPDQLQDRYVKSIRQQLIGPNREEKSEIGVQLTSEDLVLAGSGAAEEKDSVKHEYRLFAGPKRDDVLPPGAERVIDYGSALGLFRIDWISRPMVSLLKTFQRISSSWGIAIICLTVVVRGAMFPISIRTARNAAKMQAMKPELAALKEKYGNDKEKFARAQMELMSKHGANPLSGCLPLFLQLPIFIGLYQALNHAVDLRLANFLWIDNLAAPDALFKMPFALPFLGQDFNLLPLITMVLFIVQQKMFMPPPTNEQEAMQMKMMNFMMIIMGFLFYKVPAGLCVYFIASSLWGMAERKLLPKPKPAPPAPAPSSGPAQGRHKAPSSEDDETRGGGGLWAMLLKAAEKETSARRSTGDRRK